MSVTAMREYATCTPAIPVATAATPPAVTPYERSPSHHAAATPATPIATTTSRAARYDGADCQASNGASTYVSSGGQSKNGFGSSPPPWVIAHARGTICRSSGFSSPPYGRP
jgi:hypothetical protein